MSNNNRKFRFRIDASNDIGVKSAPKLIIDNDHHNSDLNVRSLDAKVYFMRNCGKSIDLSDLRFVNYINKNDFITKKCLEDVINNPEIISKGSTYIKVNSKNRNRILGVFENYLDKTVLNAYENSFRETPIVSNDFLPLTHKGSFRVFTIYNYDKIEGMFCMLFFMILIILFLAMIIAILQRKLT
ncbi:hypothetical protein [Companilactobacillus jidongensis]|uniref:hypothetical protein n=1 Tax=Companilactobacillus jidongensis TaxID=2486006 RepID=UPI000F7A2D26|nr:hypothetical protein [Companilactobacillus jidongensis]